MSEQKVHVSWECPECGHRHMWRWSVWCASPGRITMECDGCHTFTRMTLAQLGRKIWVAVWEGTR
jgi:predicted RNA-binding Zn-ribbon protein involved in translation (DUF1610 family)